MRAGRRAALRGAARTGLALLVLAQPAKPGTKAVSAMTPPSDQVIPIASAASDQDRPAGLLYRLNVGLASGTRLEVRTLLFLTGNRIARTFPFGGGDAFDQSRCNPDMCGSYQLDASQITVRWDDGRVDRWPYRRTAEGFEIDGSNYKPARPVTQAALIGTWAGAAVTGNASENVYTFGPDGAFTFGAGRLGVRGRYTVKGLTLSLAFADGTQQRRTLFAAGSGEPVGLICVEGDVFRRQ